MMFLCSGSEIKNKALSCYQDKNKEITCLELEYNTPPQPGFNKKTILSAIKRLDVAIDYLNKTDSLKEDNLVISIENGIEMENDLDLYFDVCYVACYRMKNNKLIFYSNLDQQNKIKLPVPKEIIKKVEKTGSFKMEFLGKEIDAGYNKTAGSFLAELGHDSKNWMKSLGVDRTTQIIRSLDYIFDKIYNNIESKFMYYPDFPKKGVLFCDVFEALQQPKIANTVSSIINDKLFMIELRSGIRFDIIVGPEARGFNLATSLSSCTGIPYKMIRKKGKLPGETLNYMYKKEYGEDILEIKQTCDLENSNVIIVDDLLATGGSAIAVIELLKKCRVKNIVCFFVKSVKELEEEAIEKMSELINRDNIIILF
uniref:adenine phosphoribosyltransferase n=1 Tax=viral metagenome TaxID=1070528 RepID=A0A6C0AC84_9ZZZZ